MEEKSAQPRWNGSPRFKGPGPAPNPESEKLHYFADGVRMGVNIEMVILFFSSVYW